MDAAIKQDLRESAAIDKSLVRMAFVTSRFIDLTEEEADFVRSAELAYVAKADRMGRYIAKAAGN